MDRHFVDPKPKAAQKFIGSQYSGRKVLVIFAGNCQSEILWIRNQNPLLENFWSFWREIVSPTFCGSETKICFWKNFSHFAGKLSVGHFVDRKPKLAFGAKVDQQIVDRKPKPAFGKPKAAFGWTSEQHFVNRIPKAALQ